MKNYHLAGLAIILAFAGIGAAFAGGFEASTWGGNPTQTTEIILMVSVVAAIGLALGAISTEGREGRNLRSSRSGKLKGHHVAWFVVALVGSLLVATGAGAWATVFEGADIVSSSIISLLVFLLTLLVAIAVLGAMMAERRLHHKG